MDNRKFEQLIDLIINENEEQAKALFHDIVVEKSREIYESMMDEELDEGYTVTVEEQPDASGADSVGDMMDEVQGDMSGQSMSEEEDSPDWVKAKITEASKQLSDVAHYIQGKKA